MQWANALGKKQVFKNLWKANRVGAIWTFGGMLFQRAGTVTEEVCVLGPLDDIVS